MSSPARDGGRSDGPSDSPSGGPSGGPGDLRVLVVDDHPLVRAGMRRTLEGAPGISAVEEVDSGEAALATLAEGRHDLVLLDVRLPGIGGIEVAHRVRASWPDVHVVVVTGEEDVAPVAPLMAAGVRGYLTKGADADEILAAVAAVAAGGRYLSDPVSRRVALEALDGPASDPFERLTAREREICRLIADGRRNRSIAATLHISEKTVSTHRARAFDKLGIDGVTRLVRLALKHGLVSP